MGTFIKQSTRNMFLAGDVFCFIKIKKQIPNSRRDFWLVEKHKQ